MTGQRIGIIRNNMKKILIFFIFIVHCTSAKNKLVKFYKDYDFVNKLGLGEIQPKDTLIYKSVFSHGDTLYLDCFKVYYNDKGVAKKIVYSFFTIYPEKESYRVTHLNQLGCDLNKIYFFKD